MLTLNVNKKSVHAWELTVKNLVLRFGERTIFLLQECENWPSSNDLAGGSSATVLHGHYGWFHNAGSKVGILVPPFMLGDDDKSPMSWSKGATYGLRSGRVGVMNSYLPDSEKGNDVFMEEVQNLIEMGEHMMSHGCNILIWGGGATTELFGHNTTDTIGPFTMTRNARVARGHFATTRRTALVNVHTFWDDGC